jgi:hypothetical protein
VVTPYKSPLIVFYEGDNDLAAGKSVDQVFADWTNFVGKVHQDLPDSDILFVSVKPSPSRANLLPKVIELNSRVLRMIEQDPKLLYADVFHALLTPDGQFRPELYVSDELHLSPAGYILWESAIVPVIEEWAARYPVNVLKAERNSLFVDFGGANTVTDAPDGSVPHWNNVTSVATSDTGILSNIVTSAGFLSPISLRMQSRFNGANENGTLNATNYPASATRDSLYGNTESFNGLQNITPVFKLTGLKPDSKYTVRFYASRMGVSDNRETIYTLSGRETNSAALNVANNINGSIAIENVQPDGEGAIKIALTPGANNNNANHFTYLGVLELQETLPAGAKFLLDFGSASSLSGGDAGPASEVWNNVTEGIGSSNDGTLTNLVAKNGNTTEVRLQMLSRFNAVNENGTQSSTNYPSGATMDSLYGNTAIFNGQSNMFPSFKLSGLNPDAVYQFSFYASRTGVGDNRETRYTVTGRTSGSADLDAANNIENLAVVPNVRPTAQGEITVQLTPGPNNNNPTQFTYLGFLALDWVISIPRVPVFSSATLSTDGKVQVKVYGNIGDEYRLESSTNLKNWSEASVLPYDTDALPLELDLDGEHKFYRLVQP